jgi:hypothetical protein
LGAGAALLDVLTALASYQRLLSAVRRAVHGLGGVRYARKLMLSASLALFSFFGPEKQVFGLKYG